MVAFVTSSFILGLVLCVFELPQPSISRALEREASASQLPCEHPLRLVAPELFQNCFSTSITCTYSDWGPWSLVTDSVVAVPTSQCPSGKAFTQERSRTSTGSGCLESLRQTESICMPTQEERLIIALGLGGSGNNLQPIGGGGGLPSPVLPPKARPGGGGLLLVPEDRPQFPEIIGWPPPTKQCPRNGNTGRVCENIPGVGKRSVERERARTMELPKRTPVINNLDPKPFDWLEHGSHLRSKRQASCVDQSIQHVLFVLDTSGSIGSVWFTRVKTALAKLVPLFCKQVQIAVVSFSHNIHLEFCFNCFDNTFSGREETKAAIEDIVYRGGGTHTGATAQCVCDELLKPSCGISALPNCLDVVFITDGRSNDPNLEICDEVRCLHRRAGVDTYAIGINNRGTPLSPSYNRTELECISSSSDLNSAFEFENFTAFETAIEDIIQRLVTSLQTSFTSCARVDGSISPTGIYGK